MDESFLELSETSQNEPAWFKRALASTPGRTSLSVEAAEIELLTWGEVGAPGLMFLHGFRAHADWWSHIAPLFGRTRRAAALSWSGMGRSSWREDGYDLHLYGRECLAACEAAALFENARKPTLVAHSLGGHVAILLAALHGDRFERVILVDSTVGPRPPQPPPDVDRRTYWSRQEAIDRFRFTPVQAAEPYIARWIAQNALAAVDLFDESKGWVWTFDPKISGKLRRTWAWPELPNVRCPVDFIRGESSKLVTSGLEARQREHAPSGSRFVSIPEAGHHVLADQPLALVAALRALMA